MLSNLDKKTIEEISSLSAFLDMVKNPDKYLEIVKKAEAVQKEMTKTISAFTTVEKANEYLNDAKVAMQRADVAIDAKYKELDNKVLEKSKQIAIREEEVNKKNTLASTKFEEATKFARDLDEYKKTLEADAQKLNEQKQELNAKALELSNIDADLKEKASKLKALLG